MSAREDERGFQKCDMQVMDPRQANFQDAVNLVELASEIQTADKFTRATAGSKLSVIAEQVRFLQAQAQKILEEAQRDKEINHLACNFKRIPGKVYYIYKRASGKNYMSMISPEEWGKDCPEFIAAYKLENDMSWTPFENIEKREDENIIIDKILRTQQSQLAISFN